jgi:hypothetical protein
MTRKEKQIVDDAVRMCMDVYTWHDPNEVYRVVHSYDYEAERYGMKRTEYTRNGEKNVETHTIYYRDVPDILAKPIVFRKKVANRKELALIHEYLESGGVQQPIPKKPTDS